MFSFLGLVAAVGITTGVVAWRRRAVPVTTVSVVRGDLLVRVLCDGRLEPPDGGELRVADGGTVAALAVHEGDRVRRGQLLVRLVNPDLEARARDAHAEVRRLQADSATAAGDLDRERREAAWREQVVASDRRLVAKGAIPRATLEADELAWHQAVDRERDAAARLAALRQVGGETAGEAHSGRPGGGSRLSLALGAAAELDRRLRALTVRAPFDGLVYGLPRAAGETVQAGQLVASVTDPDHPHVRCRVDQPDLPRVAPNQPLIVTFNGLPDRRWDGTVRRVGTGLREAGGREVGEIVGELSDPVHTLPANAAVDVQVVVAQKRGVLSIPRSALRRDTDQGGGEPAAGAGGETPGGAGEAGTGGEAGARGDVGARAAAAPGGARRFVYAVSRRHVHRREVTVGLIGLAEVEVLAGLSEGDRVVAEGPPTLEENVRVIEAKPTPR
ncbi:MAG TPA: HlyD family efflux transporter periplasmic adaptor subunit [Thermoanaerobaculia bacterium]|nr:HlyD family efflux transporter periplasmic adaptor subunit [Thermoanaerobaculia bacterium]